MAVLPAYYSLHPIASLLIRLSSRCNNLFPAKPHFWLTNNRTDHLPRAVPSLSPHLYRSIVVFSVSFCTFLTIACPLALPSLRRVSANNNNLEIFNNPEIPRSGVVLLYFAAHARWVVDISERPPKAMVWRNLEWQLQQFRITLCESTGIR